MRDYLIKLLGGWTHKEMTHSRLMYNTERAKRSSCELQILLSKPLREPNGRFKSRKQS